jgi:UDP-N-acetylglucosamine 2-epimerase (non-hydrolysing)
MKIAAILGARPDNIRLSRVIEKIDALAEHVLIHASH